MATRRFAGCQAGARRGYAYTRDTPDNIWHLVNERKGGAPGLFLPVLKQRVFHVAVSVRGSLSRCSNKGNVSGGATLPYLILKSTGCRSPGGVIPPDLASVLFFRLSRPPRTHLPPSRCVSPGLSRVTHEARNSCSCFPKMAETMTERSLQGNLRLTASANFRGIPISPRES